jgi:hypothetical protein
MIKKILFFVFSVILVSGAAAAGFFALGGADLFKTHKTQEHQKTKLIIPGDAESYSRTQAEQLSYVENLTAWASMNDGDVVVSILNHDFNDDAAEEQFIAFRSLIEPEGPIYAAYIE